MIIYVAGVTLVVVVGVIVFLKRQSTRQKSKLLELPVETAIEPVPVPAQNLQLGIRAFMKGRYDEAFALLEPAAHQGNLRAQQLLAKMYYAGNGVPADREKYLYWLGLAAANGDKPSKIKFKKAKSGENPSHSKSIGS